MSDENRNVAILRDAYQRWNESKGGSVEHWLSLLADDLKFGSLAMGRTSAVAFTAQRHSRAGVAEYFAGLLGAWEMIDYVVDQYVAQGDRVVAIGQTAWRNKATDKAVETPKVDTWRFDSDGRIIEFFEYYDTAALLAAAGG
jgi:ketosteroid isomerase-like protein